MFGKNHSVSTILIENIPHLLTVKCSWVSLALWASWASKKIPLEAEEMVKSIYNHFRRSTARQRAFKEFQDLTNIGNHKILSIYLDRSFPRICHLCTPRNIRAEHLIWVQHSKTTRVKAKNPSSNSRFRHKFYGRRIRHGNLSMCIRSSWWIKMVTGSICLFW